MSYSVQNFWTIMFPCKLCLTEKRAYYVNKFEILLMVLLSILHNKLLCMTLRKERIWQIQPWNTWEKQVQSGAKEVFPPPWWILDSNGISPMLGHLYNTSWLQVCTLWTVNDVSGKDLLERPPKRSVVANTKKSIDIWNVLQYWYRYWM